MKAEFPKSQATRNARVIFLLAGIYFALVMIILFMARLAVSAPPGPLS